MYVIFPLKEKFCWNFSRLCGCQIYDGIKKCTGGGQGGKSNNSDQKQIFSNVNKKEWKGCHTDFIYLESNIFKVQSLRHCSL